MPGKDKTYDWSVDSFNGEVKATTMKEAMVKSMQAYVKRSTYVRGSHFYAEIMVTLQDQRPSKQK